jgi:hypothetical protein
MKIVSIFKLFTAILAVGVAVGFVWTPRASSQTRKEWQQLPKLVFQNCVTAERSVQSNPLSGISNDFLVITAYKEYGQGGPVIDNKSEATGNTEALNIYLLVGVYLAEDEPMVLVFHNITLVVTERIRSATRSAKSTLRRWILVDEDASGVLDKAFFSEETEGAGGVRQETEIPSGQVATLQSYFEHAIRSLNKRAKEGSANACTPL